MCPQAIVAAENIETFARLPAMSTSMRRTGQVMERSRLPLGVKPTGDPVAVDDLVSVSCRRCAPRIAAVGGPGRTRGARTASADIRLAGWSYPPPLLPLETAG